MTPRRSLVALLLIAVALGGGLLLTRWYRGPAVSVVRPARREVVQTVVSSGRVLAPAEVTVAALVGGTVTDVQVTEGVRVEAGQSIATLDDRELRAKVRRAEALLARARAGAVQVRLLSLPAALERRRQSELAHEQAQRDLARDEELFKKGALSLVVIEQTRMAMDVAESQKRAAVLQVEAATAKGSESLGAAAAVEQASAELTFAEVELGRTRVVAPLSGVVLSRHVDPGDSVQVGTRLLVISGVGRTRLSIEPDERHLALLRAGQPALASAEAFPKERFAAAVDYIAPSVDARRGTIEVRLEVARPPPYLKPDMTVSVEVEVARKVGALVVDRSAVRDLTLEQPWVLVLEGGRVTRRDVGVGITGDGIVELTRGLSEADVVLAATKSAVVPGWRAHALSE